MQKEKEERFRCLLVLAYFKQNEEYSYGEIADLLGLSQSQVVSILTEMVELGLLERKSHMLQLSFKGRMELQNSSAEFYDHYDDYDLIEEYKKQAWPLDKIYIPDNFKL